jgi:hypothetical protein
MTRVKSKLAKAAKAPASLGIANFLASAPPALLCAARPVAAAKTAEGSEDEEDGSDNEDERLLQLRRLERDEEEGEDGQGNDWMAHYAGSSEEEDDEDDEGEEEDEEAEAPPPAPPRKVAKSAKPSSTASAALLARPAVALGAEASAHVTVLEARGEQARTKGASGRAAGAATAAAAAPAAPAPPKEKRTFPAAFVPKAPSACVFVGNLPLDVAADSLTAKLSAFGALKRVHMEMGNNGKPQGFGYAEFATPAAATAAAAAGAFSLGGRDAKLLSYTPQLNYRNPDGSRRKEKKKKAAASGGGGGGGGSGRGGGDERRDKKRARE